MNDRDGPRLDVLAAACTCASARRVVEPRFQIGDVPLSAERLAFDWRLAAWSRAQRLRATSASTSGFGSALPVSAQRVRLRQ
jgi:hypothetical protein